MCYGCLVHKLPHPDIKSLKYLIHQLSQTDPTRILSDIDDNWSKIVKKLISSPDEDYKAQLESLLRMPTIPVLYDCTAEQISFLVNQFVWVVASSIREDFLPYLIQLFCKSVNPSIFPLVYSQYNSYVMRESLLMYFYKQSHTKKVYTEYENLYDDALQPSTEKQEDKYPKKEDHFESVEEIPYYLMAHFFCRHVRRLLWYPDDVGMSIRHVFSSPLFMIYMAQADSTYPKKKWLAAMFDGILSQDELSKEQSIQKLNDQLQGNVSFQRLVSIVEPFNQVMNKPTPEVNEYPPLVILDKDDFRMAEVKSKFVQLKKTEISFVLFYGPFEKCKHSKEFFLIFQEVAIELSSIKCGVISIHSNSEVYMLSKQTQNPIFFVPMLMAYIKGKAFARYTGGYTKEEIKEFCIQCTQLTNKMTIL